MSVAFSPGEKDTDWALASGSMDGTVILWDVNLGSWLDLACRIANRNLTMDEWQRYVGPGPYRQTCPNLPPGRGAPGGE